MAQRNKDGTTSEFLFPGTDGISMRTDDSNPEKILRTALKRAKLIDGYEHHCRRCGNPWRGVPSKFPELPPQVHADGNLRRCPQCAGKLFAEPIPRGGASGKPMWFHCLRHSVATILLRDGVEMHHVQRILRHAKIETTAGHYAHLQTKDLRKVLNIFSAKSAGAAEEGHVCPTCNGSGRVSETRAQIGHNASEGTKRKGGTQ